MTDERTQQPQPSTRQSHLKGEASGSESAPPRMDEAGAKPRLPHEHDEAADNQAAATSANREQGEQAHADVSKGLVDTDRGPVTNKLYTEKVRTEKTPMRD